MFYTVPKEQIKGFKATRQGDRFFSEPLICKQDGRGRDIFWLGNAGAVKDGGPGTDIHAIEDGFVSVTPLHVDMTCHKQLSSLENRFEKETPKLTVKGEAL